MVMIRKVFPLPDGPQRATFSPGAIFRLTLARAGAAWGLQGKLALSRVRQEEPGEEKLQPTHSEQRRFGNKQLLGAASQEREP